MELDAAFNGATDDADDCNTSVAVLLGLIDDATTVALEEITAFRLVGATGTVVAVFSAEAKRVTVALTESHAKLT